MLYRICIELLKHTSIVLCLHSYSFLTPLTRIWQQQQQQWQQCLGNSDAIGKGPVASDWIVSHKGNVVLYEVQFLDLDVHMGRNKQCSNHVQAGKCRYAHATPPKKMSMSHLKGKGSSSKHYVVRGQLFVFGAESVGHSHFIVWPAECHGWPFFSLGAEESAKCKIIECSFFFRFLTPQKNWKL